MATKIEWCDETINPIVGCTKISPGCDNCYAEVMARRLAGMKHTKKKYSKVITESKWNGEITFDMNELYKPFRWRKPRRIFITSMGDLFHERVSWNSLDIILSMVACLPRHTFIILTKRPDNMMKYFNEPKDKLIARWEDAIYKLGVETRDGDTDAPSCFIFNRLQKEWPLSNLWLGVTAENQMRANERIPILLQIPAAKHIVSCEPLLTGVDLYTNWLSEHKLDWVIAGGESGPRFRTMVASYAYSLLEQCESSNTPFFFKGWGGIKKITRTLGGKQYSEFPTSNL